MCCIHPTVAIQLKKKNQLQKLAEKITEDTAWDLRSQMLRVQAQRHKVLFPLPADQDVELSTLSPAPCLPVVHHASHCDDNGLNL